MVLSYGITVCNEVIEVERLLRQLLENKREQDEIVVLYDKANGHEDIPELVCNLHGEYDNPKLEFYQDRFNNHFADWKNKLTSYCTGDYIVQLDADELPHKALLKNIPAILEANPNNDVYYVPRVNTVNGITKRHVEQWRWKLDKFESPNLIREKELDTESEEYKLLKEGGFIIEEHSVSI